MESRIAPDAFAVPVEKIRNGFYTDTYFNRTRDILRSDSNRAHVLMQVFSRRDGVLCGIDEAVAVLKLCAEDGDDLRLHALYDGDAVAADETVLTIEGEYAGFAHLETVYLGVLARGTSIATAVREVVDAAAGRPVLFFASRFDHYTVQIADGYAAHTGGAEGVSTDANGHLFGEAGVGTIPHGLIAAYGGDTRNACIAFRKHMANDVDLIALVDFENDCVRTSLEMARCFGRDLWGVRLDTAGDLRDVSVAGRNDDSYGVCPELVDRVRDGLDREGYTWVKIIISGGFNREKIEKFVELEVPFDAVGVGSALYRKRVDFTSDVVMVNGKPIAKVGRSYRASKRLRRVG
jgi:nicotinate phosphoribosyltransferase